MANPIVKISDYFPKSLGRKSNRDWTEIKKIQEHIDSMPDEFDIQEYIRNRRLTSENRDLDQKLFGIPENAEVPESSTHNRNRYYNKDLKQKGKQGRDYTKYDRHGKAKIDKNGNVREVGNFHKKLINVADNTKNSKVGTATRIIAMHPVQTLIAILIVLGTIAVTNMAIFVSGTAGSIGQTPFVLCSGDDSDQTASTIALNETDVSKMATKDYAVKAFVSVAKSKNWKKEAIIGTLSYILQEGSGFGTFTYEAYQTSKGPGKVVRDTTLNNDQWLSWLDDTSTDGAAAQTIKAYGGSYPGGNYAAVGIGLLQHSDVWSSAGHKTTANATALINYAKQHGNKPWQDPATQMGFFFDEVFSKPSAFDDGGVNPTSSDLTSEEWARRVTAGVGMPAMHYTDNNSYMQAHLKHLAEAEADYNNFNGGSVDSLQTTGSTDFCKASDTTEATGSNSSLADAAVSLASGTDTYIPWDMDGTASPNLNNPLLKTYKSLHTQIFPGDPYFASCDRSVATAVRWSGGDDSFPAGPTSTQYSYLSSSSKWQSIGDYTAGTKLEPGDVLVTKGDGHIKMYVGNDAVKKRFPGSKDDMYNGSFHDKFPYVFQDKPGYDTRTFAVFRLIHPDNSEKYKNLKVS
jgi:hypothetical protein